VEVPGTIQALRRSEVVDVSASSILRGPPAVGKVRRPTLLGALVAKAAATTIRVRPSSDRDWQDAALLLSLVPDPIATAAECDRKDRERLRRLQPLAEREHVGWALLDDGAYRRAVAALHMLIDAVPGSSGGPASHRS
jgi:hypothetical protein